VKRFSLNLWLVAFIFALVPFADAGAKDTWTSVRSKNFHLVGNASEKDIRRIGVQLEQFRDALSRLLANVKAVSSTPVTVVVFKSDEAFKPFRPANAAAYFQSGEDVNYIALVSERRDEGSRAAIFHEYVHFLIKNSTGSVPLWFNEGLAEYYSSFAIRDDDKKAIIGKPVSSHVRYLREQKMLPLETLFAVTLDSPIYNERSKQGVFYAESWALVHYLLLGNEGKRAGQFKQFLELLATRMPVETAFKQAFETDFKALEKELKQYIGRRSYPLSVKTFDEKLALDTEMQSSTLTEAEGQFYLGDLLLHTFELDRAEKYLQQALKLDPELALAHASLGMLNVRRERFTEAREHLQRAVAADTKNYLAHFYYAYMLSRAAGLRADSYVAEFAPETAELMRAELRKTIELAPAYAESYHLLAFVNLVRGEQLDESIELIKHGMALSPGEPRFANVLAQLYMRKRDFKSARQVLGPIARNTNSADPQSSAQAQSILLAITALEEQEARLQARADDPGGAQAEGAGRVDSQAAFQQSFLPKREGEEQARGQLLGIDCNAQGVTLTVEAGERTLRLHNDELANIIFRSYTTGMRGRIGCGPRIPANPVIVSYRAATDSKAAGDGEVTAVAFISEGPDALQ
jgi:tetratricopeptide (TPR) repeat protein